MALKMSADFVVLLHSAAMCNALVNLYQLYMYAADRRAVVGQSYTSTALRLVRDRRTCIVKNALFFQLRARDVICYAERLELSDL